MTTAKDEQPSLIINQAIDYAQAAKDVEALRTLLQTDGSTLELLRDPAILEESPYDPTRRNEHARFAVGGLLRAILSNGRGHVPGHVPTFDPKTWDHIIDHGPGSPLSNELAVLRDIPLGDVERLAEQRNQVLRVMILSWAERVVEETQSAT